MKLQHLSLILVLILFSGTARAATLWDKFNDEVETLYQQGDYKGAAVAAKKALQAAEQGLEPDHPDIAGSPNLIPGYDMITQPAISNDSDGRDSDPTDAGDAIAANECFPGSPARDNSWHGTHVAGTVGVGHTNNAMGVAGINWHTKVMAVRVLGKCGGTTADINDGIRWAAGLDVPCPVLVLSSARSFFGEATEAEATTHDIVLDVEQIRRWASSVGRHVTSIAIDGAMHDVVLSRPPVRARAYDTIATWLAAWVDPGVEPGVGASAPHERHEGRHADGDDQHAQDGRGQPATH